jgi:hypothetical protein
MPGRHSMMSHDAGHTLTQRGDAPLANSVSSASSSEGIRRHTAMEKASHTPKYSGEREASPTATATKQTVVYIG